MRRIDIAEQINKDGDLDIFLINTSYKKKDSKVWIISCALGEPKKRFEADYIGERRGSSQWIVRAKMMDNCHCVLYGSDEGVTAKRGAFIKFNGEWSDTREYCDFSIDYISVSVTNHCNLNCNMCWQRDSRLIKSRPLFHMDLNHYYHILGEISFLSPAKIFLWGGEPLLHPFIETILHETKKRKFVCYLITNGMLLEENAEILVREKVDIVTVSIDGIQDIHDQIRGVTGAYNKIVFGLKKLLKIRKFRPIVSINIVVNELNYYILYKTVKELHTFGVNSIQIQYPVFFSQDTGICSQAKMKVYIKRDVISWHGFVANYSNIDIAILKSELDNIKTEFPYVSLYPAMHPADWFNGRPFRRKINCSMAWKRLNIEPGGDVNICTDYCDMLAGNILEDKFEEIWNNEAFRSFRREVIKNNYMDMCNYCTYSYLPGN